MKLSSILLVYTIPRTNEEKISFETAIKTLKKYKIGYTLANRNRLNKSQFAGKNLIIAVGGDGTFLRASHFVDMQFMFGLNSDIKNKEGFFMKSNKKDFEKKIKKIMLGGFRIDKLPRLEARINNKKVETLALNEFYIGPKKAYKAATYTIKTSNIQERQKSSGVLVATPCGSYAWAKSCCNKTLPLDSKNCLFVVREPYEGQIFKDYKLRQGILKKHQKIMVVSEMMEGVLVADSVGKEYSLKYGSKVEIRLSNRHLNAIRL